MALVVLRQFSLRMRKMVKVRVSESINISATVKYLTTSIVVMLLRQQQKMLTTASRMDSTSRQMKLQIEAWQLFCSLQLQVFNLMILKKISSLQIQQQALLPWLFSSCFYTHSFIHLWCTQPIEPLHQHGTISQFSYISSSPNECPYSSLLIYPSRQILQIIYSLGPFTLCSCFQILIDL